MRLLTVVLASAFVPAGCTSGSPNPADSETDAGSSESDSTDETGEETEETGNSPAMASGITITIVTANQGVEIPITSGPDWVDGNARNARVSRGRKAMVRALFTVEEGWTPRELVAVLALTGGESEEELSSVVMVEGDADPDDLATNFTWLIDADVVQPGLSFQVRVMESDESLGVAENPGAVSPAQAALLGVEEGLGTLDVVLVPLEVEGCAPAPAVDGSMQDAVRARLHELFPFEAVATRLDDEPLVETDPLSGCVDLDSLMALAHRREENGDPDTTLYVGIHDASCVADGCGCGGLPGQWVVMASAQSPDHHLTADSAAHCTGLTLGRTHVACTGEEVLPDPDYPYPNGSIGVYGFSVEDHTFYRPSAKSFLSFCTPGWTSDYGWNQAWDLVAAKQG